MQMEDKLYVMDGSAKLYHYPDSEPLVDCIRFLISDFAEDYKLGDIDIVLVDILRLLIRLSRLPQKSFEPASTATQADKAIWVMRYIRENYASATLIEAAKELHYSPDYLSTLIADACGMSFSTLLNLRRAIVGREYLIDNSLSQQEVAVRLGYQSYSGFYSSFKRFFGVSPTEYRSAYKLFAIQSSEKI
jgi:AraC-like DNA-binding protein